MITSKIRSLGQAADRFRTDVAGGAVVYTALLMPILFGAMGLGAEIAVWHTQSRTMQTIADAAALAGAGEASRSPGDQTLIDAAIVSDAEANGLNNISGDQIEIRWPPTTGVLIGDARAVEVVVQRPALTLFSRVLTGGGEQMIAARAVARRNSASCVMVLHPSDPKSLNVGGFASVYFPCGITVNSAATGNALNQDGFSSITSDAYVEVVGGANGDNIIPTPVTGVSPIDDPLIDLPAPGPYGCADDGYNSASRYDVPANTIFDPWTDGNMDGILVFCQEIRIGTTGVVYESGIYVFKEGFTMNGGAEVSGTNVMWYFAPTAGNTVTINGSSTLNLTAPDSGLYAGIVMFQDQTSPMTVMNLIGGTEQYLDGIVYLPSGDLNYSGGLSDVSGSPTMLIVSKVNFSGNTYFGDPNLARATRAPALVSASLVE